MTKLTFVLASTLVLANISGNAAMAQTASSRTELAARVVALQQGPELERMVAQLARSATQPLIANWGPKLQTIVPKAKQEKASLELNAELKTYTEDAVQLIGKQVKKVSAEVLVPAYAERFSIEELQQIVAFYESPVIKKYQAAAPEFGGAFVQKLVEASRSDVVARIRQFDDAAMKIVGNPTPPSDSKAAKPVKK